MRQDQNRNRGRDSRPPRQRGGPHRRSGRPGPAPFNPANPFKGRKPVAPEESAFLELSLPELLMQAVAESGYRDLTELQKALIPAVREGRSVIASASEHSGRTVAFLVPILARLAESESPRVLIVVPTRNLASQVYNEIRRLSFYMKKECALMDAGARISTQADALAQNPAFAVGTPGRILDHVRRGNVEFKELDCLVLLEADRMLDRSQRTDVEDIVAKIHRVDQVIQMASVVTPPVLRFCRQNVGAALELFDVPAEVGIDGLRHYTAAVDPADKVRALGALLEEERPERAVVFCGCKDTVERVTGRIRGRHGRADSLHAGIPERRAKQIVARFREGEFAVLVLTDAASQDLGAEAVALAIHLDPPDDPEDYAFRLGAVARMGPGGRSILLRTDDEAEIVARIEESLGISMEEYTISEEMMRLEPERQPQEEHRPRAARRREDSRRPHDQRRREGPQRQREDPGRRENAQRSFDQRRHEDGRRRGRRERDEPAGRPARDESAAPFAAPEDRELEAPSSQDIERGARSAQSRAAEPPEAAKDEQTARSDFLAGLDLAAEPAGQAEPAGVEEKEHRYAFDQPETRRPVEEADAAEFAEPASQEREAAERHEPEKKDKSEGLFHGGWLKKLRKRR